MALEYEWNEKQMPCCFGEIFLDFPKLSKRLFFISTAKRRQVYYGFMSSTGGIGSCGSFNRYPNVLTSISIHHVIERLYTILLVSEELHKVCTNSIGGALQEGCPPMGSVFYSNTKQRHIGDGEEPNAVNTNETKDPTVHPGIMRIII